MTLRKPGLRVFSLSAAVLLALLAGAAHGGGLGPLGPGAACSPFTDILAEDKFCPSVLEIFTLGITTGITPTTYGPAENVSRLQMAAFLSRSVDGVLKRHSRRTVLEQLWTPQAAQSLGVTTLADNPLRLVFDGQDVWDASNQGNSVTRLREGKRLDTWTGAGGAGGVSVAAGRVVVTGYVGRLYQIDPQQPAGSVTTVATDLGSGADGIAFDGTVFWTANGSSVSIVASGSIPWSTTTITAGFSAPSGILFDGANIWVADRGAGTLLKIKGHDDPSILQTVTVGAEPSFPVFDGGGIWVPNFNSSTVSVVRASSGATLATLTGNGLDSPLTAAFDGERVLITNYGGDSVSLWKAADLTPLGSFLTGPGSAPVGACSDGLNFWIALNGTKVLARF